MKILNKYYIGGLLLSMLYMYSIQYSLLPAALEGGCAVVGLILMSRGIYDSSHKVRHYKLNYIQENMIRKSISK